MKKIGIYKITSPSGKIYIGQSIDINKRWSYYKKPYFITEKRNQNRLCNSFRFHGVLNHTFEVVCLCKVDELNTLERYYQELYDVISSKGLNCVLTKTDVKPLFMSDETRYKLGASNRGKKLTKEQRKKISDSFTEESKSRIAKGGLKRIGIKQSKEHIEKRIKYHKGVKRSNETCFNISKSLDHLKKKIYQYDLNFNLIRSYESLSEVKRIHKYDLSSISKTCLGKQKTSYGFIWKYKEINKESKE